MSLLFVLPQNRPIGDNGRTLPLGLLRFYLAGTNTEAPVYDEDGDELDQPIVADITGAFPNVYLDETVTYRAKLFSAAGVEQDDWDPYTGITSANVPFIQAGAGAVWRSSQSKARDIISVADYGASPAATAAVNTAAIQAAADYADSVGGFLMGAPGTYQVNDTIALLCDGDLGMMEIEADGSAVSPVILYGPTSGDPIEGKIITLPKPRNNNRTSGEWGEGVGIQLANVYSSQIVIPSSREFEIGVTIGGINTGFSYNNVFLGVIYSNKVQVGLVPGATGWANQNNFFGGRLGFNTTDFTVSGYTGTRMLLLDKGPTSEGGPNGNTFFGTSIESNLVQYGIEFRESANANQFINLRYEEAGARKILCHTDTASGISDNLFIGGYDVASLEFTFSGSGTSVRNAVFGGPTNAIEGSGVTFNLSNRSGGAFPHLQGFAAGTQPLGKTSAATDWLYRLFQGSLAGKAAADAHPRLSIEWDSGLPKFKFGDGSAAPAVVWTLGAGSPEGVVTSAPGGLYLNTSGGAGTTIYGKESGTGNTGWVAYTP